MCFCRIDTKRTTKRLSCTQIIKSFCRLQKKRNLIHTKYWNQNLKVCNQCKSEKSHCFYFLLISFSVHLPFHIRNCLWLAIPPNHQILILHLSACVCVSVCLFIYQQIQLYINLIQVSFEILSIRFNTLNNKLIKCWYYYVDPHQKMNSSQF